VVGGEESSSILADRARAATNSYSPWLDYDGQWAPVAGELTGRRVAVAGELLPIREYLYVWKKRNFFFAGEFTRGTDGSSQA